eukprot:CAMPEP_0206058304 /NCGR_PEP_ID=MMETSP1466-20131121/46343_1 /ASSEMBLY_ACC=CAM_ASM_001126 /TAXON_ID=44452 /ORGANISM="Pavlova gyrans, Strain CCMP608" /LENGTH=278 /DNA_ID=CAMNT_0053433599 /DNA_START=24 /DNA_END=860 /DNA_ORIENTATION=-
MTSLRGGFKTADDVSEDVLRSTFTCKEAGAEALAMCDAKVAEMGKTLDMGEPIPAFGEATSLAMEEAVAVFDSLLPKRMARDNTAAEMREELKVNVLSKMHVAFQQQLQVLKTKAIQMYQEAVATSDVNVQGMLTADQYFVREASASIPEGADWSFQSERQNLQTIMQTLEREWKKGVAAKIQAAQQMSTAMQYLQVQQAQLQQLQQQLYGGGAGKWNIGAAYRPPDTNINLSFNHQQGRTNIVASMVPDEQQSLLGPNGFTNGVGPANLGVSLNVNV